MRIKLLFDGASKFLSVCHRLSPPSRRHARGLTDCENVTTIIVIGAITAHRIADGQHARLGDIERRSCAITPEVGTAMSSATRLAMHEMWR